MTEKIRIDKFFADQNICSRKDAGKYIRKGLVTVDNAVTKKSNTKIDPEQNIVKLNGNTVQYSQYCYIMMNKPKGVLSASRDKNAKTVIDLIPDDMKRKGLFPAGRLDKDTTGLLIITNDGELAHKMLAPKSHVYKIYQAKLDINANKDDQEAFKQGISTKLNDFLPAEMWWESDDKSLVTLSIREGKFHQVKRMFLSRGKTVVDLKRLQMGNLKLDKSLAEGECRLLKKEEIEDIFVNITKK